MIVDFYTTTLILGIMLALIGGSIGYKLVSSRGKSMTANIFNERLALVMDQNKELKYALKISRGTVGQMKEGVTLPDGTNLENLQNNGGFDGIIKGLISKYSSMAPPQLRPFLQDPAIVGFLLEEAKKNPEQTKEILKHFMSNNGKIGTGGSSDESQQLENQTFQEGGA